MAEKTCPQCGRSYSTDDRFCTVDGAALIAAAGQSIIGTVLAERFLVQEKLGEGGMGEVYLAEHVRMKRKVALKLMRPWMLGDPVAVGRFHREAENASQISHPNVAQVYDFGETADRIVYLAMEFVDGEPLSKILHREGRLNIVRTAEIVRQVAEALVAAHGMGILHRDLKPDNVMVARSRHGTDVVKLVDFGIARAMNRQTQQFTSTGLVVGTPDYMSPEQLSGDELDGRSDLYALALMAYRMLAGGGAYSDSSSGESLVSRLTGKPKALASWHPEVPWPQSLQNAFERALRPDPSERYDDPREFAAEVDRAILQMPLGEDEQNYLVALANRHPTPVRGGLAMETPTGALAPVRSVTPSIAMPPVTPSLTEPQPALTIPTLTVPPPVVPPSSPAGDDASTDVVEETPIVDAPAPTRKRSPVVALGGGIAVLAAIVWAMQSMGGSSSETTAANAPAATAPDSAAGPVTQPIRASAADSVPAPAPAVAAAPGADTAALNGARRASLALWSGNGRSRGTAVLMGQEGIAVTAASLVPSDSSVLVFLNPDTRVRATVLSVSRQDGIATLLLPTRRCPRCQPLTVAASNPAVGDSVVVVPVASNGREDGREVLAAVTGVNGKDITLSQSFRNVSGATVVSRTTGQVIGLLDGGKVIGPTALGDAVTTAKKVATGRQAPEDVVPIWPMRQVSSAALGDEATRAVDAQVESYRITRGDLTLLAMTPQVMKRRNDVAGNTFNLAAANDKDPVAQWGSWKPTIDGRRGVVVFYASHKDATFLRWPQNDANLRNAEAASIQLFRNDTLVTPIESARIPSLTRNGTRPIPTAAVASYSALEFREGDSWRVNVLDGAGKSLLSSPVPPGTLEAIRRDLASVLR